MNLLMIVIVTLTGRITQWEHFTHYGGVSDIMLQDDLVLGATSGGVVFGLLQQGSIQWDSTWNCPGNLSASDARCLAMDGSGNLWIGTRGGGIDVGLSSGGFQHYGQLEGLPNLLQINCILPADTVWVGTTEGLCSKELGYFSVWTTFSTGGGLPSDIVNCIAPVDSGLFVGTSAGLVMLRKGLPPGQADSWLQFANMESSTVQDILVSGDTAWAATTDGLFRYVQGSEWLEVTSYPGDYPVSLAEMNGSLAVGGKGEISILEGSSWIHDGNMGSQVIQDIQWLSMDTLLIAQHNDFAVDRASGSGIGIGYPGDWRSFKPQAAPSNDLYSVDVDTRNDVWVTTNRRGAAVLSDQAWTEFSGQLSGSIQIFSCMADHSGGVFIAPWHYGVTWIDWQGTPERSDDVVVYFNTSNSGLLNDQVTDMSITSEGDVWFAQEAYFQTPNEPSGVCRLDWNPGEEETASWQTFTPEDGLPSGDVRAVENRNDPYQAWMGTNEGLVLGNIRSGSVVASYTTSDGLPSNDIQALARSRDNKLYIGTTGGLVMISSDQGNVVEIDEVSGNISMLCIDCLSCVWAASGDGLYRIYPDGTVEEYNTLNSPLQSHDIRHAACDRDNGYLYLVTDHGLWKLQLEQGLSGELATASVYPNPFLPGSGQVLGVAGLPVGPFDIRVFDLTGALVYESLSQERDHFTWDGDDSDGNPVSSGTYMVRIEQNGSAVFLKLAVVR